MNSYYKCASGGRFVTIWPTVTDEAAFYDVVYGDDVDEASDVWDVEKVRVAQRVTVFEAAAIVLTELGTPVRTTVDNLAGMISRWRVEFDEYTAESCNTCDDTGRWETTTEDSPTTLVDLGPCPDCFTECDECGREDVVGW